MSSPERPIGEDDLQLWIDGRLNYPRREQVEAYLANHPDIMTKIIKIQSISHSLRENLQFKLKEPIPARLRISHISAARGRRHWQQAMRLAAACSFLLLGGGGGWLLHGLNSGSTPMNIATSNAQLAFSTYVVERLHPVEVGADDATHMQKWLSNRLGHALPTPDLSDVGYKLIGGRVLPSVAGPAAMLMYGNAQGERLTLYASPGSPGENRQHFISNKTILSVVWRVNGLIYVVTAAATSKQLGVIATDVQKQIDGRVI